MFIEISPVYWHSFIDSVTAFPNVETKAVLQSLDYGTKQTRIFAREGFIPYNKAF